jgi:hypothetical protein
MGEEAKKGGLISGWIKAVLGGMLGLLSGAAAVYGTAVVDRVVTNRLRTSLLRRMASR